MKSVLFLQSDEPDPYAIYAHMLLKHPIYRDDEKQITAVYSYKDCYAVLNDPAAIIPPQNNEGLNEYALTIAGNLARFRNPPNHAVAKQTARGVFQSLQPVAAQDTLAEVLAIQPHHTELDWAEVVCKQVPVLTILKGFGFEQADRDFLVAAIGRLVRIMQPNKTAEQIRGINEVAANAYNVIKMHIIKFEHLNLLVNNLTKENQCKNEEILTLCIANLAGLLTQSYDACRGLLSNALLYLLSNPQIYEQVNKDRNRLERFMTEILRFDPPVHNTRRLAAEDIFITNKKIDKGEIILVVLAAANRDGQHFSDPNVFNSDRVNNTDQLTFGAGMHACLANQFAVRMATDILLHFFTLYPSIRLLSPVIEYEAIVNGRLPKSILISLT